MKKYRKNFDTKRMTVEAMATCYQKCHTSCIPCTTACGTSPANGAALYSTPALNGDYNMYLSSIGTVSV